MGDPPAGPDLDDLRARGHRLRLDAAAAEVFRAFEDATVRAVLLKGRTISEWLYGEDESRPQADCDLLVAPSDLDRAEAILLSLGYQRNWDDRGMPTWWREHAGEWRRSSDGVTLDVHRTLAGAAVDPDTAWEILSADLATVRVAGAPVPALAIPARALHIALHVAHHGAGPIRPLEDLRRAIRIADSRVWRAAAELAAELGAVDGLTMGLQLDPAGRTLARELGLTGEVSARTILHASSPPPVALGFAQLAQARGVRRKLTIALRKAFPPPDFIRHWDPRATQSRTALLRAYARRPLWLLSKAPRGLRAWRQARNSGRN